jgi:hypothetical protein
MLLHAKAKFIKKRYKYAYSNNMYKKSSGKTAATEEALKSVIFRVTITSTPAVSKGA